MEVSVDMAQEQQKLPVIAYVVIFVLVLLVILPRDEAIDCGLRPSVERGFFIAALEERVYFNLSLTSYRGLSILVKNEKGLSQSCQIPEDGSPFVVVMKQKSHSYQWELSHDGKNSLSWQSHWWVGALPRFKCSWLAQRALGDIFDTRQFGLVNAF